MSFNQRITVQICKIEMQETMLFGKILAMVIGYIAKPILVCKLHLFQFFFNLFLRWQETGTAVVDQVIVEPFIFIGKVCACFCKVEGLYHQTAAVSSIA